MSLIGITWSRGAAGMAVSPLYVKEQEAEADPGRLPARPDNTTRVV